MKERLVRAGEAAPKAVATEPPGTRSRLGAAISSPRGVLLTVPALVVVVGIALTGVGQHALETTSASMAEERFVEQSTFTSHRIGEALAQADPVLDRVRTLARDIDPETTPHVAFALALRDLVAGRPGMTQAYVAFPDGTFEGVYLEGGALHLQASRRVPGTAEFHHFTFSADGLVGERDEKLDYDPRRRDYYKVAVKAGRRAWTDPYPFFTTGNTGVTCTEPVLGEGGRLYAVVAVDFDVGALSSFMGEGERSGVRSLVFADDGSILAYPSARARIVGLKPKNHALDWKDIDEPLLNAFFAARARGEATDAKVSHFRAQGEEMLGAVTRIGGISGPRWNVAVLASEASLFKALRDHRRQSLLIAAAALLFAVLAAWIFARHIVRARREVAVARARAAEASRQVTELGSYELVECLGKGGMGEVWRARHRLLARESAIKLIGGSLARSTQSAEAQERFKREAQTIASLRSRNTVDLYDYGVTDDGTFFYVMELLDGIDLETLTERYGPQPAARVVALLIQACNSLAEAHDAGLVHRDIKPANIFVCRAADEVDVLKILDFGLVLAPGGKEAGGADATPEKVVKDLESEATTSSARLTRQGSYLGTPTFIAPEQALGREVDGRADLYALGCVAWWLLTGKLVFPTDDPLVALTAHMTRAAPALRPLVKGPLPEELEELIARLLAKDPQKRPANAREVVAILAGIGFGEREAWTTESAKTWWKTHVATKKTAIGTMDTMLSEAPAVSAVRTA